MNSVMGAKGANFLVVFSVAYLVCSCAAPQYDSAADKAITDLQHKIHLQMDNWISGVAPRGYGFKPQSRPNAGPPVPPNIKFYDDVDTDLTALEIRMEASPDPSTVQLPDRFSGLKANIAALKQYHIKECPGPRDEDCKSMSFVKGLQGMQKLMDIDFANLMRYELTLKSGTGAGTALGASTSGNQSQTGKPNQP